MLTLIDFSHKGTSMNNYRIGIVGTTHQNSHLYSLNAAARAELVSAVARTEAERNQFSKCGIPTIYSDYEEMLSNEDLDIVELDTNPIQRHELILAAAERGIHVLAEKPISASLEHADQIVLACNEANITVAVHHIRRCDPYHIRAKALLADGLIGDLLTIRATLRDPRPAGHSLINLGTHLFDIIRFFGGDVHWLLGHVTSRGKDITPEDIESNSDGLGLTAGDKASVTLGLRSGITATVEFWMAEPQYFGVELIGTKGILAIRQPESPCPMMYRADALWSASSEDNAWRPIELPEHEIAALKPNRWDAVYRMVVDEFIRCIEEGTAHSTSADHALKALELIMGTYESHRLQERVSLPLLQRKHPLELWLKD